MQRKSLPQGRLLWQHRAIRQADSARDFSSNRRIGGKDPPKRAGAIARCCDNKKCFRFSSETLCRASRVIVAARVRNTSLQLPILDCISIIIVEQKFFKHPEKFLLHQIQQKYSAVLSGITKTKEYRMGLLVTLPDMRSISAVRPRQASPRPRARAALLQP